jgi:DnaJ family protein A protein 2
VFSSSMPAADVFGEIFGGLFKEFNGMFGDYSSDDSPYSTGSARPRRSRPRQPGAVTFEITASLEELFIGTVRHVKINRTVLCQPCAGSGSTRPGAEVICPDCRGRGVQMTTRRLGFMMQQFTVPCTTCQGQGRVLPFDFVCKSCKGNRTQEETKSLELNIPAGSSDGQRFVLRGEGDCFPGADVGDVVFLLKAAAHRTFERRYDDLISRLQISLTEALCGCCVELEHLDGRLLRLRPEPGQVVKPGCWRRVTGEGMPIQGKPEAHGDLFIHFDVVFPDKLDPVAAQQLADSVKQHAVEDEDSAGPSWLRRLLRPLQRWMPQTAARQVPQMQEEAALNDATEYILEVVDDGSDPGGGSTGIPRSRL